MTKNKYSPIFLLILAVLTLSNLEKTPISDIIEKSDCSTDCCRTLSDRLPMTYTYYQKSGRFVGGSGDFKIDTHGYSGQGKGYNNPELQCVLDIGPLPASTYKLAYCKNIMLQKLQKPCSFYLDPQKPEQICGLGDFFIHGCQCCTSGDDSQPPSNGCSEGCVIINYENRRKLRIGDILIVKHYQETNNQILYQ